MSDTKPIKHFRDNGVEVAVWKFADRDSTSRFSVTIKKSYKSGDEWKDTNYIGSRDVPTVGFLLQRAYGYIQQEIERNAHQQRDLPEST